MTPEFDHLCKITREKIALQPRDNLHSLTKYLTKDQEMKFQSILQNS